MELAASLSIWREGTLAARGIELESGDRSGAYGWFGPRGYERPDDPEEFWRYSTADRLVDQGAGVVGWRAIVPAYRADLLIRGDSTHFAIEVKDNLIPPPQDPRRPKGAGPGVGIEETLLGTLEAERDHQWKRISFSIAENAPREADGRIRMQLGGGDFGLHEFYGSALFSRIIAARGPIPAHPSVDGCWPTALPLMTDARWYDRMGKPYVPIIGDAPFGNADATQWEAITLMGIHTQIAHGSAKGAGNRGWSSPDFRWNDPVRGDLL